MLKKLYRCFKVLFIFIILNDFTFSYIFSTSIYVNKTGLFVKREITNITVDAMLNTKQTTNAKTPENNGSKVE